jgi:outer membrane protein assembly factor BamB
MELDKSYMVEKDNIVYRMIDNEAVILNLDNGRYYNLNTVGTKIWNLLYKGKSIREILNSLKLEYSLPEQKLIKDIMKFIKHLKSKSLLKKD